MTDAETLDAAIENMQAVLGKLAVFRAMIQRLGDVKTQHDHVKQDLQNLEQQRDQLSAQVAAAQAELKKAQQGRVDTVKEVAKLEAELTAKRQEYDGLASAVAGIKAKLEVA